MDWRVDFSVEPDKYLEIHFQRDEEKITIPLYCVWNSGVLVDLTRALIALYNGAREATILLYDLDIPDFQFCTFFFKEKDSELLFELVCHGESLLQIQMSRVLICQMFWRGMRRFQGAGLMEQYNSLCGRFPEADVNELTQLLKAPKR